ncbi:MAG: UDP-N-acetylmuramoyl-L-alanine--D-glutamate ligase [Clostridiales bacterium]|jgi:UDP-N-acetylmuramoylalanine--D-glutamate ligase|nr:UDP-N-acetylmuramoyl-L-alanine--D-glutamate ligase [Clostridiales bacterium]
MGKNILIVGFKRSGISAARLMKESGCNVYIYDEKPVGGGFDDVVSGDRSGLCYKAVFDGIDTAVLSPSVDINCQFVGRCRAAGIEVIGEIECAYRAFKGVGPVTAVTGTNGKTTTTALINDIYQSAGLKSAALGNIGIPFSDFIKEDIERAVVEVSSFQLESIVEFRPDIAVFLNFAPDHLDRHKTEKEYFDAKLKIFENQTERDFAVINADDEYLSDYFIKRKNADGLKAGVLYFSTRGRVRGAYADGGAIVFDDGKTAACEVCKVLDVPLIGRHNVENALAAVSAAYAAGIPDGAIRAALRSFKPAKNRIEFVKKVGETAFYNDSKGTNIHAAIAAARSMTGSFSLILGGSDKGEDFGRLFAALPENVCEIFVTGANAKKITAAAKAGGYADRAFECATLEECIKKALKKSPQNILLSPASASFDRYKNYEERGADFVRIVNSI